MPDHSHELAAILFADVVGYTAMMQLDESDAVAKINRFRQSLEVIAASLDGKIIQYYGDGSLLLFHSSTNAAEFAKLLQQDLNLSSVIPVRIGIHMGDVLIQNGNVFGDVVNIASRIQALAPAGGIYISEIVFQNIANKKSLDAVFIKEATLKNVKEPVRIYEIQTAYSKPIIKSVINEKPIIKKIEENSIAVLPFSNISSNAEQEYFSDGLTEDIITQLSKIKSLKVISRTSVMQYKKNPKKIKEIGQELGVAVILEGSVQRYEDQVRITAQLINTATDDHLWAESYDRPVTDIFAIQREVALAIASILNTKLSKRESENLQTKPTVDLQAYDLYLRGKFLIEKRNKTDLLIARELFHQAVNKDKNFGIAFSGLADTYLLSSYRGYEDPDVMLSLARKHIDMALELEPTSGEIQATLGYWYHQTFNWQKAETTYRHSIKLNPHQTNVYLWLAILLEAKGEKEEAHTIYDLGSEVNPIWDYLLQNKIRALVNYNGQDEAIRLQLKLVEKSIYDPLLQKKRYADLSKLYWALGNKIDAIDAAEKANDLGLIKFYKEGSCLLLEKEVDDYYRYLKKSGEYVSEIWKGLDYAKAGAREKALASFNNAIFLKEAAITLLLIPQYEFLNIKYLNLVQLTRKIKKLLDI
jgi:TolB-like protein